MQHKISKKVLTSHLDMTTFHTIIFVLFTLLWLGLAYIILDLGGVTLYNILVVLVAGGIILLPLWKRWRMPKD